MLDAMRKLRWGRAWVAAVLVCAVVVWPGAAFAQSDSAGASSPASPAAAGPAVAAPAATGTPSAQDAAQNQDSAANPDSSAADSANSSAQPVAKNLETGAPLRVVMSPLHWGHLSLLSFQGFEVYDANYQPQQAIVNRTFTALQGLVVYSIQKEKSSLDLQYEPYVWFSRNQTYKDFTANSVDLSTSRTLSRHWRITGNDDFQYSPNLANSMQSAFSTDFVSNTSNQVAFLSAGRKSLINNVALTVSTQLSKSSQLSFTGLDNFIRLGSYSGSLNTTLTNLPTLAETMNAYGGGVTWTRQWNTKTSLNLAYNFRRQSTSLFTANSTFNTVDVGFNRILKPSVSLSLQVGPGWSDAGNVVNGARTQRQTTVQGSAQLLKSFRTGGIAFSFYRNSEFSGVISNSYNNRYDVSVNRRLLTRWNFLVSGSYIQQEYVGKPMNKGELGWAQLGYMLTRNWSIFSGYRYLNLGGNQAWSGPQQMVAAGIRWAWQPQNR